MRDRKNTTVEIAILGVLGAFALLCLAAPQLLRDREPRQLLSVSVLLRDTDSSGWTVARQGMEQAADELGAELRFLTLASYSDSGEQNELLLREIDGGAEGLVVVPADAGALRDALLQRDGACPVVALESAVEGCAGVVAPDNALLGRRLAQALLEDWDGGGVLLLEPAPGCAGVVQRLEAAQAEIRSLQAVGGLPELWRESEPLNCTGYGEMLYIDPDTRMSFQVYNLTLSRNTLSMHLMADAQSGRILSFSLQWCQEDAPAWGLRGSANFGGVWRNYWDMDSVSSDWYGDHTRSILERAEELYRNNGDYTAHGQISFTYDGQSLSIPLECEGYRGRSFVIRWNI